MNSNQYQAPFYLRNPHLQTILNGQGPRAWRARRILRRLDSEELLLEAEDGTRLLAEYRSITGRRSARAGHTAARLGRVEPVLLYRDDDRSPADRRLRRAARQPARSRRFAPSEPGIVQLHALSAEVASALRGFTQQHEHAQRFIAGFSLGGSFALRVAADAATEIGLNACIAVCPPIDPARAMDALNQGLFIYERYFFRQWHDSLRRKLELFPDFDYADKLAQAKSLDDLNRLFIPDHTVYECIEDYFAAYSLVGARLSALAVPAHLIAALDDPIIPGEDLERIDPVAHLHIETHRKGGHCGFIENLAARSWVEGRILQLLQAHAPERQ